MKITIEDQFIWIGIPTRPWRRFFRLRKKSFNKKPEINIESFVQRKLIQDRMENRQARWEHFPRI